MLLVNIFCRVLKIVGILTKKKRFIQLNKNLESINLSRFFYDEFFSLKKIKLS